MGRFRLELRRLEFGSPAPASTSLPLRVTLGVLLSWMLDELRTPGQSLDKTTLEWCAFTVIVIAAPTLGSVASKGIDRTVGTVLGGLVCAGLCYITLDGAVLTAASFFVAVAAVIAAELLNKDYSMKLFLLTFLIIAIGAEASTHGEIVQLALLRVQGIVEGVILVTVLTILLWPQAASTQAVTSIREALTALEGLQAGVWENGAIASGWAQLAANTNFTLRVNDSYVDEFLPAGLVDKTEGVVSPMPGGGEGSEEGSSSSAQSAHLPRMVTLTKGAFKGMGQLPLNTLEDMEEMERRQEGMIDAILASLAKAEASIGESSSEIYVGSLFGWPIFMPGVSYSWAQVGWQVPAKELKALAASIRKVTRVYWSMQRAFQEGFDEEMMRAVVERYPPHMLTTLQDRSASVLKDMVTLFPEPGKLHPKERQAKLDALLEFCTDVKACEALTSDHRHAELRGLLGAPPQPTVHKLNEKLQRLETLVRGRTTPTADVASGNGGGDDGDGGSGTAGEGGASLEDVMGMARDMSRQTLLREARRDDARLDEFASSRRMSSLTRVMGSALRGKLKALIGGGATSEGGDGAVGPSDDRSSTPVSTPVDLSGEAVGATGFAFPNTREGHISKVRWYSFLFLLERLAVAFVEMHERVDEFLTRLPAAQYRSSNISSS